MFTFLKIIKLFFLPPVLIAAGILLSFLFFMRRKARWGIIILLGTFVVYYLLSIQPTAYFLARSLEKMVPSATIDSTIIKSADAIIVLAGGAQKQTPEHPFAELGGTSWRRLWRGIELFKLADGKVPLFYSGGSGNPFDPIAQEAELAKQYGLTIGIPGDMFWIESESRDTYESSLAVKNLLDKRFADNKTHKIILVTSARHMPRSLKTMNKVGITAIPQPADFSAESFKITPLSFFPSAAPFSSSVQSIHEWVGLLGYKLRKRI